MTVATPVATDTVVAVEAVADAVEVIFAEVTAAEVSQGLLLKFYVSHCKL